MPDPTQTLTTLKSKLLEIRHLKDAAALLSWDQETHMPAGGGQTRAEQLATLQTLAHSKFVDPEIEDLLLHHIDPATGLANTDADGLDDASKALFRETWRDFSRAKKLPSDFINRLERECSLAQQLWAEARRRDDFLQFLPNLQTVVALKFEEIDYLGLRRLPVRRALGHLRTRGHGASTPTAVRRAASGITRTVGTCPGMRFTAG